MIEVVVRNRNSGGGKLQLQDVVDVWFIILSYAYIHK
jgi:hypothetical protein